MSENALKQLSIVYVEDDPFIRENVSTYLRRRVSQLHEAENGKEALQIISEHRPQIVLTDLEMPVMNGFEMIEEIRKTYDKDYPIIVITGYHDDEHYSELADHHIYKPIDMPALLETIGDLARKYNIIE